LRRRQPCGVEECSFRVEGVAWHASTSITRSVPD
jgi:hypothetical protein